MTATELVGIIAAALFEVRDDAFDEDTWEEIDGTDREEYECQARAVLDALTEAGTVEWGLLHGDRPRVERCFTERYAKQCAAESESTLVSRLTLRWTAAAE